MKKIFLFPTAIILLNSAFAQAKDVDLNYWGEDTVINPRVSLEKMENIAEEKFWVEVMNPKNQLFWEEQRIQRFTASNPSPDRVKKYLAWKDKHHAVLSKFVGLIQEEDLKKLQKVRKTEHGINWKNLAIQYYYSSNCGACQEHQNEIADLQGRGVKIEFISVKPHLKGELDQKYKGRELTDLERKIIKATPTLIFKYENVLKQIVGTPNAFTLAKMIKGEINNVK